MSAKTTNVFCGYPRTFGGLSNERELAAAVPPEFRKSSNPWAKLAGSIFFGGADTRTWAWRSEDKTERADQLARLRALLMGWDLPHEDKEAVAGWMLSEMLTEVPA